MPVASALVLIALAACSSGAATSPRHHHGAAAGSVRSSAEASSTLVHRRTLLGHSVKGRSIFGYELGNPGANERALVVGCIHGNECAGIPIARKLIHEELPRLFELLVIPDLNPDGFAANTRQNGRGVDLNRNFPYRWVHEGQPWSTYYSGPKPLSEPESRIARRYILDHRPDLTFWFHQHENLIWASGGTFGIGFGGTLQAVLKPAVPPNGEGISCSWPADPPVLCAPSLFGSRLQKVTSRVALPRPHPLPPLS